MATKSTTPHKNTASTKKTATEVKPKTSTKAAPKVDETKKTAVVAEVTETVTEEAPAPRRRGRVKGQKVIPHDQSKQLERLQAERDEVEARYQKRVGELDAEIERRYALQVERHTVLTERDRIAAEKNAKRKEELLKTEKKIQESLAQLNEKTKAPEIDDAELAAIGLDDLAPIEVADEAELIVE